MDGIYKLSATGNSFLFINFLNPDSRPSYENQFKKKSRASLARELCNPHHSVGADGLLFIEPSSRADLKWDFYNADGSRAEMCGNAARCAGLFVRSVLMRSDLQPSFTLETLSGVITITTVSDSVVQVEMPQIKETKYNIFIKYGRQKIFFNYVNSGVPHAVVRLKSLRSLQKPSLNVDNLEGIVDKIRKLKVFTRRGVNVTFYSPSSQSRIESLTFERGVMGYTQACGTGAVAAAYTFAGGKERTIIVNVPGGQLKVDLHNARPHLEGSVKFIAEIKIWP